MRPGAKSLETRIEGMVDALIEGLIPFGQILDQEHEGALGEDSYNDRRTAWGQKVLTDKVRMRACQYSKFKTYTTRRLLKRIIGIMALSPM